MGTGRMDAVKASLQIMLKSLPSRNTTFNIVSFGSSFTSLWSTSRAYSAESVEEASRHVDSFSSNYGGTELRSALEFAFSSRAAHGKTAAADKVPASVFILTDGEAWDLRGVLDTVSNRVDEAKRNDTLLRAFVLGVGNQVSTAMCEGIARAGKGTATFVAVRLAPFIPTSLLIFFPGGRKARR
jgi:von Willebrand factor type A domain